MRALLDWMKKHCSKDCPHCSGAIHTLETLRELLPTGQRPPTFTVTPDISHTGAIIGWHIGVMVNN